MTEQQTLDVSRMDELLALPPKQALKGLRAYCKELYGVSPGMGNVQHCVDFIYNKADGIENTTVKKIVSNAPPDIDTNRVTLDEQPKSIEPAIKLPIEPVVKAPDLPAATKPTISKSPSTPVDYSTFRPTIQLSGRGVTAFMSVPYWIHDWVATNAEWKTKIAETDKSWHSTLKTMVYYININGFVNVRESRNSIVYNIK
ncbi:MAG: hypothetical protein ACRC3J_09180 [Culicoidibacterales bacterium]